MFIPLSFLTTMVYYDPDVVSKFIMAKPNARIDVIYLIFKTILCLVSVLWRKSPWPTVITTLVTSFSMFVLNLLFLPFYRQSINNMVIFFFFLFFTFVN